jgi:hypothetical protein
MMTYELAKTPIRSFREIIIPANDVGLSSNSILLLLADDTNKLKEFLHAKIEDSSRTQS